MDREKLMKGIEQIFTGFSTRFVIGMIAVIGCFAIIGILLFHPIPRNNEAVVFTAIGIVLGYGGSVLSFYFGSSKDSSDVSKVDQATKLSQVNDKPINE